MRRRLLLLLTITALGTACWGKKTKRPAVPPPKVVLRKDVILRAGASNETPVVMELKKGSSVTIVKLRDKWSRVKAETGEEGWLERNAFARRTALYGTGRFPYTGPVADALRKIPEIDLVRQETTARLMPGGAAGGLDGAEQLDGGVRADLVVGVTGAGRQFMYEIVDRQNKKVLMSGTTDDTMYLHQAVSELASAVAFAISEAAKPAASPTGSPDPNASPTATTTATPTPKATSPHPNAPLTTTTAG